jgi:phosphomannomutase / phosphoglucomutase
MSGVINPAIFREYDIRGVAARDLSDEVAYAVGRAAASLLAGEGVTRICLGRDVRESSPRLHAGVAEGIRAAGVGLIDVGVVPSPVLYYAVLAAGAGGGVMITGSHNPIEYNGFKLCRGTAPIWGDEIRALGARIAAADYESGHGGCEILDILPRYRQMVVERCGAGRRLRIVVDAGNGTGGLVGPAILADLGHQVVPLYCEPDGRFPNHLPDPTVPAYMRDLQARVVREGADLGIGFDGDADRIGLVDEGGRLVFGDQILALYARDLLARQPGSRILFDVKCSQGLADDIRAHGGEPVMWKTGHSLLKAKMKADGIPLAGEMSGHMFFGEGFFGFDDAIYGAARMAAILAGERRSLAGLVDSLPQYVNSPEIRIECTDEAKFRIVDTVAAELARDHPVVTIDGVRASFGDGWGLLRASNTQPVLVLRFEARTRAGLERIQECFRGLLAPYPEVHWTA